MDAKSLRATLSAAYLELDPRSLGLFRILFGLVLLGDLLRQIPAIPTWFAADGVVPPEVMIAREQGHVPLSIFLEYPERPVLIAGFVLFGLVYVAYLIGYRTRLSQVLVIVSLVTLHGRASIIEHAGERSIHIFAILTAFLPLGARFSIDAVRARRPDTPPTTAPARSIAVLAMLLQLSAIYLLDWAVKLDGNAWKNGSAIIGAIQPMTGTPFGFLVRDHAPILLLRGFAVGTLLLEFMLWPLLLIPLPQLRLAAAGGMVALHLGIWSFMNLGIFQPVMIAPAALLLTAGTWSWLERTPRLAGPRRALARARDRLADFVPPASRPAAPPRRELVLAREALAAAIFASLTLTVLGDNDFVPAPLHTRLAFRLRGLSARVGVFEHWEHYTNPSLREGILVVDAVTRGGRHVDPVNLDAFGYDGPPLTSVPPRCDLTLFWWNYQKVFRAEKSLLLPTLEAWIERFPARTKNPDDEIVSYEIRWVATARDPRGNPLASSSDVIATCEQGRGCR
jgi:Vitamin K-dependent gamma-carboxylase